MERNQLVTALLNTADAAGSRANCDLSNLFIEIYYQSYIEPLEDDFDEIPNDAYFREQISFYVKLEETVREKQTSQLITDMIHALRRQWKPYLTDQRVFVDLAGPRNYLIYS